MPKPQNPRKARFQAALGYAGMTATEWAREHGITHTHLAAVLDGRRESRVLMEKIEAFTKTHLKALGVA